jgi:dipeptidyl aminopeptidase/acylaminoacyl peptidase
MRRLSFGLVSIIVFVGIVIVLIKTPFGTVRQVGMIEATPTPFPYEDMTIPYLRSRTYTSQLGDLQNTTDHGLYTSYRTSYESDGLVIFGQLTIPKDDVKKHPAIVFVHGYIPPTEYKTDEKYVAYVDYLARNGFVVFKIDLRGHDQSEGQPSGAYYSSGYVIDTLNARAALEAADFVNPNEIGLWGHSMAGNIVMRAFAARPQIPAVVIWAGAGYTYADLTAYRISDASYRPVPPTSGARREQQGVRQLYGQFDATKPFWQQVAVTNYLKDLKGAIEIHHAVDDPVVSIEYSRNLMKLLDATNVPHQLYEYSSGGHNITDPSFSLAMSRTVEFFHKYLP